MAEDWQRHDPRSYGAELDGVADDTIALTRWAAAGGYRTFPALTARITASIPLISDTTIVFAQGALLTTAVPGISLLKAVPEKISTSAVESFDRPGSIRQRTSG